MERKLQFRTLQKIVWTVLILMVVKPDTLLNAAEKVIRVQKRDDDGIVRIPYGRHNIITYDLRAGTATVGRDNEVIFSNMTAEVKLGDRIVSSADYHGRRYSAKSISDRTGRGKQYIFTAVAEGLPEMRQIFYVYPGKEFFVTKVELRGKDLESNYMSPLKAELTEITGDVRSLFVPFDNDAFVRYNARPFVAGDQNLSAEVGAVYDNTSRKGVIAGSLEQTVWKTAVKTVRSSAGKSRLEIWGGLSDPAITRDQIRHGMVRGAIIKSPTVFAGYFSDWREGLEEYARAGRSFSPPYVFNWIKPTPVGWNSWGVIQDKLNFEKVIKVTDFFADSLKMFRTGNTAWIDMDSFWDNIVRGGMSGDFGKLKEIADYCLSKGLQPGVYWAPFTDWGDKSNGKRRMEGSNYTFGDAWTKVGTGYHDFDGARALDPTHPGTQQRIVYMIKKLKDCGFKMIKIDFLGHAAAESSRFYDTTVTTGMQAYRRGMEFLIRQLNGSMLVYAAISPSMATARYAHMRRVACDAFQSIDHTNYTLNSLSYGWWQTYLYNYIDADHVVFSTEKEGVNRARLLSAVITGTLMTGDDFSASGPWVARAKIYLQNKELLKLVKEGEAFRPVEGNTGDGASTMFSRVSGRDLYLAVFNYGKEPKDYRADPERLGLPYGAEYTFTDVLNPGKTGEGSELVFHLEGEDAALYRLKIKKL